MKNLFRKIVNKIVLPQSQLVYAQNGEDLLMAHLFYKLGVHQPSYLDIGANDPRYISNTYYFYIRGSRGVCIEPNPRLAARLRKIRPADTVINCGIGLDEKAEADFYLFPPDTDGLSTFSKEEAEYWQNTGMKGVGHIAYEKVIRVPLLPVDTVLAQYFSTRCPDFISLDVEGLDLDILRTIDYIKYPVPVICVETLGYDTSQKEYKRTDIISFMQEKGYHIYADTHVNTIFTHLSIFNIKVE